jgi:hypothetical protein
MWCFSGQFFMKSVFEWKKKKKIGIHSEFEKFIDNLFTTVDNLILNSEGISIQKFNELMGQIQNLIDMFFY